MKKLVFLIILLGASHSLMAQKTQFGLKMGVNLPSLQPETGFSPSSSYKTSIKFLLGVVGNIKVGESAMLQSGLLFSVKGNKSIEQKNTISLGYPIPYTTEKNINIHYLELPINLFYTKEVSVGTVYLGGGPYAAYAIGGRMRTIDKRNTYYKKGGAEAIEFGNQPTQFKSGDFGLNASAGFRLENGIDFGASYGFGFANISNDPAYKSQNRVINLSLGYFF